MLGKLKLFLLKEVINIFENTYCSLASYETKYLYNLLNYKLFNAEFQKTETKQKIMFL